MGQDYQVETDLDTSAAPQVPHSGPSVKAVASGMMLGFSTEEEKKLKTGSRKEEGSVLSMPALLN